MLRRLLIGEAEQCWAEVIDDLRHGTLEKRYKQTGRPNLSGAAARSSIFAGKRYLAMGLVEAGAGVISNVISARCRRYSERRKRAGLWMTFLRRSIG